MCGRFSFTQPDSVFERFHVEQIDPPLTARFNVSPSQKMPVIVKNSPNHLELMTWGFTPKWAEKPLINAKAETLDVKGLFKHPFENGKRCLIPADGFYEWRKEDKQPFYIKLKTSSLFAFAGLYDTYPDKKGREVEKYTIITTKPNSIVEPIHDRMPVILNSEDEETWLNPAEDDFEMLLHLLKPYRSNMMQTYGVSRLVNNSRSEGLELIKPI